MFTSKLFLSILILSSTTSAFCKPTDYGISEGRGIGSTVWGWVTYPFTWWASTVEESPPFNDQLVRPAPYGPFDNIEIAKRNVTVWCNDHTCTTMKCDKNGCKNNTCNIYDTDMNGECREYNIVVTTVVPVPAKPNESVTTQIAEEKTPVTVTQEETPKEDNSEEKADPVERPLELEVVLSSTVNENKEIPAEEKKKTPSPQNKI